MPVRASVCLTPTPFIIFVLLHEVPCFCKSRDTEEAEEWSSGRARPAERELICDNDANLRRVATPPSVPPSFGFRGKIALCQ